jgi:hypothetical protein
MKKTLHKANWGGARSGAGRPKGAKSIRKNRVVALLTDTELRRLRSVAKKNGVPFGTMAHRLIVRGIK